MKKLKKWLRSMSATEKGMIISIILLVIAIAIRWSYIKPAMSEAVKDRFNRMQTEQSIEE